MDLADFPNLEQLCFSQTSVGGDFRRIKEDDFPMIRFFDIPKDCFSLDRVDDAELVMAISCRLQKTNGAMIGPWTLRGSSQDSYPTDIFSLLKPPFVVRTVQAGPRIGWRWSNGQKGGSCETNWLDREPVAEDNDYGQYLEDLKSIQASVVSYRGFFKPPTLEEYQRLTTHW